MSCLAARAIARVLGFASPPQGSRCVALLSVNDMPCAVARALRIRYAINAYQRDQRDEISAMVLCIMSGSNVV